jgi:hypothetical protein
MECIHGLDSSWCSTCLHGISPRIDGHKGRVRGMTSYTGSVSACYHCGCRLGVGQRVFVHDEIGDGVCRRCAERWAELKATEPV